MKPLNTAEGWGAASRQPAATTAAATNRAVRDFHRSLRRPISDDGSSTPRRGRPHDRHLLRRRGRSSSLADGAASTSAAVEPERIRNHAQLHRVGADAIDGDDVEAAGNVETAGVREVVEGHGPDPTAFAGGQRLDGRTAVFRPAGAHLDEHNHGAVAGDDVNFSKPRAVTPGKNCVPAALELRAREIFAAFSGG